MPGGGVPAVLRPAVRRLRRLLHGRHRAAQQRRGRRHRQRAGRLSLHQRSRGLEYVPRAERDPDRPAGPAVHPVPPGRRHRQRGPHEAPEAVYAGPDRPGQGPGGLQPRQRPAAVQRGQRLCADGSGPGQADVSGHPGRRDELFRGHAPGHRPGRPGRRQPGGADGGPGGPV